MTCKKAIKTTKFNPGDIVKLKGADNYALYMVTPDDIATFNKARWHMHGINTVGLIGCSSGTFDPEDLEYVCRGHELVPIKG